MSTQHVAVVPATTWKEDTLPTKHAWQGEGRQGGAQTSLVLVHEMHKVLGHV